MLVWWHHMARPDSDAPECFLLGHHRRRRGTEYRGDAAYPLHATVVRAERPDAKPGVDWQIARRPSSRKPAENEGRLGRLIDEIEHLKASVRAKVEHAFRVVKRQFGHTKVRYRGLTKNTAQLHTLFALTNLWLARRQLMALDGQVRPERLKVA